MWMAFRWEHSAVNTRPSKVVKGAVVRVPMPGDLGHFPLLLV